MKIGRSSRLQTRVAEIQVGSPEKVEMAHAWKLKKADALAFEGALHKLFRWARKSGEWHNASVEEIKCVGDLHLAGDAGAASALAEAIRDEAAAWAAYEAASAALRSLNWRSALDPEKVSAREELDRKHDLWCEAGQRTKSLGFVSEWGFVADEALERARARAAEPKRPVVIEPNPNRVWQKPKGSYDHKAALANYKAARGIAPPQ